MIIWNEEIVLADGENESTFQSDFLTLSLCSKVMDGCFSYGSFFLELGKVFVYWNMKIT